MKQDIENLFPALVELCRQQDHDEDCPQDDTCKCEEIQKLNQELKLLDRMINKNEYQYLQNKREWILKTDTHLPTGVTSIVAIGPNIKKDEKVVVREL